MNKIIPTDHDESTHGSTTFNLQNLETGENISTTAGGSTSSMTHMITNGICSFSPTSTKGKWIFLLQTIILSFTPITILLIQNGTAFYDLMQEKDAITHKNELVMDAMGLSRFSMALQWERAAVSLAVFLDARSGQTTDLSKEYSVTDVALRSVQWRRFGPEKVFENPLRFQIRIDDFRKQVTDMNRMVNGSNVNAGNKKAQLNDKDILDFYNLATGRLLTGLEKDLGNAQSSSNWKILMAYFNMIQCLESAGIGLVYGLRFYSIGELGENDLVSYLGTHALMYEYYRQAQEIVPDSISKVLHRLFTSEAFQIVNTSTTQILENVAIDSDLAKGRRYFEGSVKFMRTLQEVLDMLIDSVNSLTADKLHESFMKQMWGVATLCLVIIICPLLGLLSKNAIASIQIFALSVEKKSNDMKKQKRKQEKLVLKMLPKAIVQRVMSGETAAETFDQATLYFSSVDGFVNVSTKCNALQVVKFLNKLYMTMDKRMDNHDVYKVETISDQYLVVSGVPKKNGDAHASEICNMALDLKAACGSVVRPDIAPRTITIRAGVHTGKIVAGVVGSKMPRYCLFGDTINTTSRMQSSGEADKIQISKTTWLMLSMKGGYIMEERGVIEVKGKGEMQTYWLLDADRNAKKAKKEPAKEEPKN